ncbi:MAG TPA: type IV toxin-antitoxin system AbiEi family antitoxin domain-containing protein [Thermoanaerobaculia bacterium]|nr:type IV toxin-antitoxin system AbiEi family antitoxin domain-containing protein [Thermoanaerobaculia bacterium]
MTRPKASTSPAVLRPRDFVADGLPRERLYEMVRKGDLVRVGRGLYTHPNAGMSALRSLAEAAKVAPNAVVCLLTALRFHDLTTQSPSEVWLAVENKAWRPRVASVAVRFVYMSGEAFTAGLEVHQIDGVAVQVYSAAKTVADCFKFRHKIGIDVAIEALRDYLRRHRGGADELWKYAKVCRVARVMRPYLEAVS